MNRLLYSNGFIDVEVDIDDSNVAYHVQNYLISEERNKSNNTKWKIQSYKKKSIYNNKLGKSKRIKGEYGEDIEKYEVGGKEIFFNVDNKTIYFWDSDKVLVICNDNEKGLFIDTYRAIRQLLINDLLNRGGVVIHSSSIYISGKGYLFVGSKGAGKTSSLFQYLNCAKENVSYGSNERTLLVPNGKGISMYGWPGTAFVGVGTIKSTIGLEALLDVHKKTGGTAMWLSQHRLTDNYYIERLISMGEDAYDVQEKIWLTSNEIAKLTERPVNNYGFLDKVIWPNLIINSNQKLKKVKRSLCGEVICDLDFFEDWLGTRRNYNQDKNKKVLQMLLDFSQYEITGENLVADIDKLS